jgi:Tol biopolymer transport system component
VRSDVFVRDRVTGRTERVSVATGGTQGNGASDRPSISADGRFVAFDSNATNLVAGDTNGRLDVFVRDRVTGTTERLTQGNSDSFSASISADGRSVAFESSATNLVAGDTNGFRDVFVFDRVTGATELVSVATDGTQGNGQSDRPSISADGRFVAFGSSATNSSASSATNLVAGDTNSHSDVFVRDRLTTLSLPGLSISDAGGREGSEGTSPRSLFIVSLSAAMPVPVFVDFWVDNGTARAGSDFTPKFGTLTFNPGVTERSLTVTVSGDNVVEHDETFVVNLDVPVFAVIARGRGVGTILNDDLPFGTAELTPATATVAVHERLPYSVTWTVPPPLTWHDLDSVELRIRDDQGTILWVGFDEAAGTLGLLNAAGHRVGPAFPPGHRGQLESSGATLYLRDSRVEGSGPTGPSVTLTLEVSFKPRAAGRTYVVEVLAVDDAGQEQIEPAGTLTVTR